jgi:hypothetical protein
MTLDRPRCEQEFCPEDTINHNSALMLHLDCRLPHRLSGEERALLFQHCWDHAVADCASCARWLRQHELLSDPFAGAERCPKCTRDLTDTIWAHLYGCVPQLALIAIKSNRGTADAAEYESVTHSGTRPESGAHS